MRNEQNWAAWSQRLGRLIEPSPAVSDPLERRRVRFLAALILVLSIAFGFYLVAPIFGFVDLAAGEEGSRFALGVLGLVPGLGLYALARSRYYRTGARLTVAVILVLSVYSLDSLVGVGGVSLGLAGSFVSYAALVAALLLPTREVILVALACTLAPFLLQWSSPEVPPRAVWGSFEVNLFFSIAAVLISFARDRDLRDLVAAAAERQAARERALLDDRLRSLGLVSASVAHEINNPLTYIVTAADTTRRRLARDASDLDPENLCEMLDNMQGAAYRISTIVSDLRSVGRRCDQAPEPLDPVAPIRAAVNIAKAHVERSGRLEVDLRETPLVRAVGARISQVALNLVINAAQALDSERKGNRVTVRTYADGARCVLEVLDNGRGFDEEARRRVFEPFFTTKGAEGTGLGLYLTREIVAELGGTIDIDDEPDGGTRVRVGLPGAEPPPKAGKMRSDLRADPG